MNSVTSPEAKRRQTCAGVEAAGRLAAGTGGQRAQRHVDQAVHVVQRQDEHDPVVGGPRPRRQHRVDHRGRGRRGCGRRPSGVRSCRSCRPSAPGRRAPVPPGARLRPHERRRRLMPHADADPLGHVAMLRGRDDRPRPAVADHVGQLGVGVLGVQRARRWRRRASRRAGRSRSRARACTRSRCGRRRLVGRRGSPTPTPPASRSIVVVRPRPARIDDRQPVAVLSDALRQRLRAHGPNRKRR